MATITIDPTLQSLIPRLTVEEYRQLEDNIRADGCRDPLIVWEEQHVLLDGHHRLQICEQHGIDYRLQEIRLPDFAAAKAWMIANQLGRRNLTPDQMSYYRGMQYNLQKQQGKRTDLTSAQTEQKSQHTAATLAAQHQVSPVTIRRDAAYAEAVETLAAVLGPDVRHAIQTGELHLTRQDVPLLASLVKANPETVQAVKDALTGPDPVTTLKAILSTARCGICHRPLSDPASVSRGIGPICAGHSNGSPGPSGAADGARSVSPPLTERERAYFGPRTDKPPGSVAWCWQTIVLMQSRWKQKTIDEAGFKAVLEELQAHEAWNVVPPEQPYGSLERLVATELGLDLAWFLGDALRALHDLQLVVADSSSAVPWAQTAAGDSLLEQCQALGQAYRGVEDTLRQMFPVFDATVVPWPGRSTNAPEPAPASDEVPAPLIPERNYCIVHVSLSNKGSADFESCTLKYCFQTVHFYFWTHDPCPTGLVWVNHHRLCRAHAEEWCTAHQVDIGTIPTISSRAWIRAYRASNFGQVPWFRFATAAPAPDLAETPGIPAYDATKFQLGKLCANKHAWGQTGQTLRRINGRGCQQCDTEKKRQQYAPRKERDGH